MSKKIVVTGGTGRFGMVLKSIKTKHKVFFPNKSELNILNYKNITNYVKINKPKIMIHLAGLSRPMKLHDTEIAKSIDLKKSLNVGVPFDSSMNISKLKRIVKKYDETKRK